ncbi:hypothetical protein JW758_03150 [Candidatus Peregrinibacteria bacterium]|nr:hypothetical protein [Candidatus Peregrinibacteria bacterium]
MIKTLCFSCFLALALFTSSVADAKVNRRAKITKYKGSCTDLDNMDSNKRKVAVSKCRSNKALFISAKYDPVMMVRYKAAKRLRSEALRAKLRAIIEAEEGLSDKTRARFLKVLEPQKERKKKKMVEPKEKEYKQYPPIEIQIPPPKGFKKKLREQKIAVVVFTNGRLRSISYVKRKLKEIDPNRINRLLQDVSLDPSQINVYEINYKEDRRSKAIFKFLTKEAKKGSARVRPRIFVREGKKWYSYKLPRTRSALKVVIRFARKQAKKWKIEVDDIDIH